MFSMNLKASRKGCLQAAPGSLESIPVAGHCKEALRSQNRENIHNDCLRGIHQFATARYCMEKEAQGWALVVSEASPILCLYISPLCIGHLATAGFKFMGMANGAWQEMGVQREGSPTVGSIFRSLGAPIPPAL